MTAPHQSSCPASTICNVAVGNATSEHQLQLPDVAVLPFRVRTEDGTVSSRDTINNTINQL